MEDIEITCKDCGKRFILTVGEQTFYAEKEFPIPKRCKECRKARKNKVND